MSTEHHQKPTEADVRAELTRLWLKSQPALEAFVRSAGVDREAREDIIQNTAEHVSRSFDQYDKTRPFTPWVIGIARFRVLEHIRTGQREKLRFSSEALEYLATAADRISDEMQDRYDALEKCMARLQPKHKTLMRMRYIDDLKPVELAKVLDTTPNAVSLLTRRVRLALAQCIEKRLKPEADPS